MARQFRQVSDFGRNIPGRLAGGTLPDFPATDATSFAEAKARIDKSLDYVKGFTAGADRRLRGQGHHLDRTASGRCHSRAAPICCISGLPNFFFHATTAYNILRHRGVVLGKRDFLGSF